jgi:hypothetical protein
MGGDRGMSAPRNRPSGLAVVGYGLTLVGFVQVAVTIAPHVAQRIPDAGTAAPLIGVAVALAADIVWAALGHTTIRVAQTRQWGAVWLFGGATGAAILASTVLLAAVGHMGPWSAIPACAALLLAADGLRSMVVVSPDTAEAIRGIAAQIRDERALARVTAQQAAHAETIAGVGEAARLAARAGSLAQIRVQVEGSEARAARALARSAQRHAAGAAEYRATMSPAVPEVAQRNATVTQLSVVEDATNTASGLVNVSAMSEDEKRTCARELRDKGLSWSEVAEAMDAPRSSVRRWAS